MGKVRKLLKSSGLISNKGAGTEALLSADFPMISETHCSIQGIGSMIYQIIIVSSLVII